MKQAKIKEDFTMGGIFYKSGEVGSFTEDQVERLPRLLEEITLTSIPVENEKPFLENTAQNRMILSDKKIGRGRPKTKNI